MFWGKNLCPRRIMGDPLFVEIESKLTRLDSDATVHTLIELLTSVNQSTIPDSVAKQLVVAAKLASPSKTLPLLKFAYLYGKKDARFLSAVRPKLATITIYCYQVASDKETLKLYLGSWLMNPAWKSIGEDCLGALSVMEHTEQLRAVCALLRPNDITDALTRKSPAHTIPIVEKRLASVIQALNLIQHIS